MPRRYRYALICLLVGCVPPPAGGYPSHTYPQGQYQQPPQHGGDYGDVDGNGDGDGSGEYGDYGNGGYGNGDARNGGGSRNRRAGRAAPRAAGQWTCSAEASFGTAVGEGSMNYSVKTGYGTASTREEAVTLALKDCGETVNVSILIAEDMRTEIGTCALSRCNKIGR